MEKTVTQYVILEDFYINNLINETNSYIEQGWQPYGPFMQVLIPEGDGTTSFLQPMVRYARTTRDEFLDDKLEFALTAMKDALHSTDPAHVHHGKTHEILNDEPVWVALGRRIVELEQELAWRDAEVDWIDAKAREYGYSGLAFVIQNRGDRPIKDFEESSND